MCLARGDTRYLYRPLRSGATSSYVRACVRVMHACGSVPCAVIHNPVEANTLPVLRSRQNMLVSTSYGYVWETTTWVAMAGYWVLGAGIVYVETVYIILVCVSSGVRPRLRKMIVVKVKVNSQGPSQGPSQRRCRCTRPARSGTLGSVRQAHRPRSALRISSSVPRR